MAKFLTTKQISSALEELIREADKTLYIVSPYLKLSQDFQELINSRNKNEKKTIIIYGKVDLTPEQLKFLTGLRHVYLKFHEKLHAKCYANDTKIIITSMNFYEYSMINNKEMGVLYDTDNPGDLEIYNKAIDHIKFIEENSNDKPFELSGKSTSLNTSQEKNKSSEFGNSLSKKETQKSKENANGFCVRTGVEIPFSIEKPMCYDAYKTWSKYSDGEFKEKFCHFSGEPSYGETSYNKPILKKYWKKAQEVHGL